MVKNPPAMQETPVRYLGWEDPLEKGKATHSSVLAWRIPWDCKELDTTEWLLLSLSLCWRHTIPLEMFCKTEDPFTLLPHCISLSILPFDFSSSALLSLWSIKGPGIQTPIRWLFWGTSLPSSQSASSQIKVSSLPQHLIFWIYWLVVQRAERAGTQKHYDPHLPRKLI